MSDAAPPVVGGGRTGVDPPTPPRVVLYGRPGCHLCDDALAVVLEVRARCPFALTQVDIESDDGLLERYLERIPVLCIDGRERFELFVAAGALEAALRRA
ncbi:MAG: glutaredoxin family protein [Solirubrobacteraceae bacterium]